MIAVLFEVAALLWFLQCGPAPCAPTRPMNASPPAPVSLAAEAP